MEIAPLLSATHYRDITPLLPKRPHEIQDIWDSLRPPASPMDPQRLIRRIYETKWIFIPFGPDSDSGLDYERYLQFPNARLEALSASLVSPGDNGDQKIYNIEKWVKENIRYISDLEHYGLPELWSYPLLTVQREAGDCEDGAFLIHSLALHAGVAPDRLRTYGGIVFLDGAVPELGGHAWTAYRREIDDQWVVVDWCFAVTDAPIAERAPMSQDLHYLEDYFYVQANRTVDTTYVNRIRHPVAVKGLLVDTRL